MKFWGRKKAAQLARRRNLRILPRRMRPRRKRAAIAENLRGCAFARLWRRTPLMPKPADQKKFKDLAGRREVETPAALLPGELSAKGHNLAWLSQQTIGKIKARHPKVTPADMLLAQKAGDGADVFRQGAREWIGFARDCAGKLWAAAWKRNADGKIYITSIHRARPAQLRRAAKKWRRVRK